MQELLISNLLARQEVLDAHRPPQPVQHRDPGAQHVQVDLVAEIVPAPQLQAVLVPPPEVDHVAHLERQRLVPEDSADGRLVAGVPQLLPGAQPEVAGLLELDAQLHVRRPDELADRVRRAQPPLPVRDVVALEQRHLLARARVLARLLGEGARRGARVRRPHVPVVVGVPQPVALALDAVPPEPPVDHVARAAGELRLGRDVAGAVGERVPPVLDRLVAGLQQPADLRERQDVARRVADGLRDGGEGLAAHVQRGAAEVARVGLAGDALLHLGVRVLGVDGVVGDGDEGRILGHLVGPVAGVVRAGRLRGLASGVRHRRRRRRRARCACFTQYSYTMLCVMP